MNESRNKVNKELNEDLAMKIGILVKKRNDFGEK